MTTEGIQFHCPKCGAALNAKDELAGKQAKCPKCEEVITVPEASKGEQ